MTVTITVKWTGSGYVYDSATLLADQVNSAPSSQQNGRVRVTEPDRQCGRTSSGEGYALLGIGLLAIVARDLRRRQWGRQDVDGDVAN